MRKIILSVSLLTATFGTILTSCSREFTETEFHQSELAGSITTVEQLRSFVNGTYVKMRVGNYLGSTYRGVAEVHTDEMYSTQASGRNVAWSQYNLVETDGDAEGMYYAMYQVVGNANIVINASDNLTEGGTAAPAAVVKHLKGQAYAARALAFFDLLRLYGQEYSGGTLGIVLPLEYDPNRLQARSTVAETRAQIESDFQAALANLSATDATKNTLNIFAVKALMSRYYLYTGNYTLAAQYADEVINSNKYSVIEADNFLKSFDTVEPANSVFELTVGTNGSLGVNSYAQLVNSRGYRNLKATAAAISAYESGDVRATGIVSGFLNGKFAVVAGTSNIKVVRYEEVLLNAAEAHIQNGNTATALTYYNKIRENRGLAAASSVTLALIKEERMRELIGEGFRYFDLLRWNETIPYYNSDGSRDSSRDKTVGDNKLAFPIPRKEILVPGSLVTQNP